MSNPIQYLTKTGRSLVAGGRVVGEGCPEGIGYKEGPFQGRLSINSTHHHSQHASSATVFLFWFCLSLVWLPPAIQPLRSGVPPKVRLSSVSSPRGHLDPYQRIHRRRRVMGGVGSCQETYAGTAFFLSFPLSFFSL